MNTSKELLEAIINDLHANSTASEIVRARTYLQSVLDKMLLDEMQMIESVRVA